MEFKYIEWTSISYMNELVVFFTSTTFKKILAPQGYFLFPCLFNAFKLGCKQGNFVTCYTLHHIIITLGSKCTFIKVISTCHVINI